MSRCSIFSIIIQIGFWLGLSATSLHKRKLNKPQVKNTTLPPSRKSYTVTQFRKMKRKSVHANEMIDSWQIIVLLLQTKKQEIHKTIKLYLVDLVCGAQRHRLYHLWPLFFVFVCFIAEKIFFLCQCTHGCCLFLYIWKTKTSYPSEDDPFLSHQCSLLVCPERESNLWSIP